MNVLSKQWLLLMWLNPCGCPEPTVGYVIMTQCPNIHPHSCSHIKTASKQQVGFAQFLTSQTILYILDSFIRLWLFHTSQTVLYIHLNSFIQFGQFHTSWIVLYVLYSFMLHGQWRVSTTKMLLVLWWGCVKRLLGYWISDSR